MRIGRAVFAQFLDLFPRRAFERCVPRAPRRTSRALLLLLPLDPLHGLRPTDGLRLFLAAGQVSPRPYRLNPSSLLNGGRAPSAVWQT
jgi:hypothetical protein